MATGVTEAAGPTQAAAASAHTRDGAEITILLAGHFDERPPASRLFTTTAARSRYLHFVDRHGRARWALRRLLTDHADCRTGAAAGNAEGVSDTCYLRQRPIRFAHFIRLSPYSAARPPIIGQAHEERRSIYSGHDSRRFTLRPHDALYIRRHFDDAHMML